MKAKLVITPDKGRERLADVNINAPGASWDDIGRMLSAAIASYAEAHAEFDAHHPGHCGQAGAR